MGGTPLRFERLPRVVERFGYRPDNIYRLVRLGRFPAQIKLGERASAWISSELDAYAAALAAGATQEEIKSLVRELHQARVPAAAVARREAFGAAGAA